MDTFEFELQERPNQTNFKFELRASEDIRVHINNALMGFG